jgi:hypothetical protein
LLDIEKKPSTAGSFCLERDGEVTPWQGAESNLLGAISAIDPEAIPKYDF